MPESSAFNIPDSPIAALGTITLLIAFVVAAYGATTGIIGNADHRRRLVTSAVYSLYAFFALTLLASALMIYAFVTHDYTIKYVSQYSDTTMPLYYKITAYWGGLDGSMLFWVSVLAAFAAIAVRANHMRHRDMIGYVVAIIMLVQCFFLALIIYDKNPFATWLTQPPVDGKGLNPLLQNYWMVIHPPSLYVGYVAATIPFAFGMGALLSGRLDDRWLSSVRIWVLICWFFLSLGLILGGRWAYEELGWGGYWAWDPVENAGLLPWFTATAFLHSVIIQEQRGMLKAWNLFLVIFTFLLTIMGTFMTRSGWVQSVHAFGQDNRLGLFFVLFMAATAIFSFGLLLHRAPQLRSTARFESFASREFAFLLNNWVLLGCALFVLILTWFPTISELAVGDRITVGPPTFNKFMVTLGMVLLFLAGAAPLLAWRHTTEERLWAQFRFPLLCGVVAIVVTAVFFPRTRVFTPVFADAVRLPMTILNNGLVFFCLGSVLQEYWVGVRVRMRQSGSDPVTAAIGLTVAKHRKFGGYIVHIGVAMMFFGFGGKAFESMEDFTVTQAAGIVKKSESDDGILTARPGESFELRGYTFEYLDLEISDDDHKQAVTALVALRRAADAPAPTETEISPELRAALQKAGAPSWMQEGVVDGKANRVDDTLKVMRPARWRYKKLPEQPTTEVDISMQWEEDVYLILTGFNPDTKVANFRVYVNPLVNWVWLGFALLALGTAICLFSPGLVSRIPMRRSRSRLGRAGQNVAILLALGAGLLGLVEVARAQAPAEYQEESAHVTGVSAAHLHRPKDSAFLAPYRARVLDKVKADNPGLTPGSPDFEKAIRKELKPVSDLAAHLMEDLVCLCGGCQRESLLECRCGYAANERKELLGLLRASGEDLLDEGGRERAYDFVVEKFVAKYEAKRAGDGNRVLMSPPDSGFNRLSWVIPYAAFGGGLLLLFGFGRRWVKRGQEVVASTPDVASPSDEDDEYAELLDDELRETE